MLARRDFVIRQAWRLSVDTIRLRRNAVHYFRGRGVNIGDGVEILGASLSTFGSEPYLITIGDHVTISHGVDFITHDGGLRVARDKYPGAYFYGRIHVGDRCFLGAHTILLPGARVGADSVIGSGSIVTGEIPSGVVAMGAPAKPVKSVEDYIQGKRHLWIDTGGMAPDEKKRILWNRLPDD